VVVNEFYEKNTSGIFALLTAKDVPWKSVVDAATLDNSYRYMHATNLICSSLCDTLDIAAIVEMIYSLNIENWNRLYSNYKVAYEPIENYNLIEEYTRKNTGTQGNKQTGTSTTESSASVYAYNVTTPNPATAGNATVTPDLANVRTDDLTEHNELNRHGNIGVTTSAQMISENIELWKWKYFNEIFKDIDSILTTGVYQV